MDVRSIGFIVIGGACLPVFVQPGFLWANYGESPVNVIAYPVEDPNESLSPISYRDLPPAGQTIFKKAHTAEGATVVYGSGYQDPAFNPFYANEYVRYQNTTYEVELVAPPPREPFWATDPAESLLRYLLGGLGLLFVIFGTKRDIA